MMLMKDSQDGQPGVCLPTIQGKAVVLATTFVKTELKHEYLLYVYKR